MKKNITITGLKLEIEIDEMNDEWGIFHNGKKIGNFSFLEDEKGRFWISGCEINESYRKRGIGSNIIKNAVKHYGEVYFCTATKTELSQHSPGYDSRYLTEEGVIFLESCLRQKIIKPEWARKP